MSWIQTGILASLQSIEFLTDICLQRVVKIDFSAIHWNLLLQAM